MSKYDGGPAFPIIHSNGAVLKETIDTDRCGGMTLRDYFAAKAMQSIM